MIVDSHHFIKNAVLSSQPVDSQNLFDKYCVSHCIFTSNQQLSQTKLSENIKSLPESILENHIPELST